MLDRPCALSDIHRFWFGELRSPADFPEEKTAIWYQQSDEIDRHIRERFGKLIPEAAVGHKAEYGSLSRWLPDCKVLVLAVARRDLRLYDG